MMLSCTSFPWTNERFFAHQQLKSTSSDKSTRSNLVDCGTQTDLTCSCSSEADMRSVSDKHTISTSTCTEGIVEGCDEDEEKSGTKGERLTDNKKVYLMFDKNRTEVDANEPVYLVKRNGERWTYFYRAEDSKSEGSSPNENIPSPMVLSTSSLDVSGRK